MTDYFTSDWHLDHLKVACLRYQGLEPSDAGKVNNGQTLDEARRVLSSSKNRLFILGDLTSGRESDEDFFLWRLGLLHSPQQLHFIPGNHDSIHPLHSGAFKRETKWRGTFSSISPIRTLKISGQRAVMSHYPYDGDHTEIERDLQWRPRDLGAPILHGHTHSEEVLSYSKKGSVQINVGWDAWRRFPSKEEISQIIEGVRVD